MRFLAALALIALFGAVSGEGDGWHMKDRFAAFRFEVFGEYDRRQLSVAIRDAADMASAFGERDVWGKGERKRAK